MLFVIFVSISVFASWIIDLFPAADVNTPNAPTQHEQVSSWVFNVFSMYCVGHVIQLLSTTLLPTTSEQGPSGSAGRPGQPVSKQQDQHPPGVPWTSCWRRERGRAPLA